MRALLVVESQISANSSSGFRPVLVSLRRTQSVGKEMGEIQRRPRVAGQPQLPLLHQRLGCRTGSRGGWGRSGAATPFLERDPARLQRRPCVQWETQLPARCAAERACHSQAGRTGLRRQHGQPLIRSQSARRAMPEGRSNTGSSDHM